MGRGHSTNRQTDTQTDIATTRPNQCFAALRRDTEISEKLNFLPSFQNQAGSKLNTALTLKPNT